MARRQSAKLISWVQIPSSSLCKKKRTTLQKYSVLKAHHFSRGRMSSGPALSHAPYGSWQFIKRICNIFIYWNPHEKKAAQRQPPFCLLTNCKIQFGLNLLYKYKGDQTVSHPLISHYLLMQFHRCLYHSLQVLIVFR